MKNDQTASPNMQTRIVLMGLSAAYFFVGVTGLGVIGLAVEMSASLGVSASLIAATITGFAIVYAVAAPGLQALFGGLPRRGLICTGLILCAASCLLCATAAEYTTLMIARVGMAVGAAITGPTASAAAADMVAPEWRARALSLVFAGMTLSSVLGLPAMSLVAHTMGWRWAWVMVAVAALAVVPLVWTLLPQSNRGSRATLGALVGLLRDRAIALTVATTAIQIAGQFVVFALLAVWLVEHVELSQNLVPPALLLFGAGGVAGNAVSSVFVRRFGAEVTVQIGLGIMMASLLAMALVPPLPAVAVALSILWSISGLAIMAPMQSRLVQLSPRRVNLSLALNASTLYVGMATGSALAGALYGVWGATVLPLFAALIVLLALMTFRSSIIR